MAYENLNGKKINMALLRYEDQVGKYVNSNQKEFDTFLNRAKQILGDKFEVIDRYQGNKSEAQLFEEKVKELRCQNSNRNQEIDISKLLNSQF
jgi:hypothetical protein|tara:strand:- start:2792 stop:3070 length:279 start_codon:yes stop_codon:yes gene_type:complete